MPPNAMNPTPELTPPASTRATGTFARALTARPSRFATLRPPAATEIGAGGRAADALGRSLLARSLFSQRFDRSDWLSALLSRYRIGAWASDTPGLHYLRRLRGLLGASHGAGYDGFASPPLPPRRSPLASDGQPPHRPEPAQTPREQLRHAQLLPHTLAATQPLPAVLQLHHISLQASLANRPPPPPLRMAFPERMAEAVTRRQETPSRRGSAPTPEREPVEIPNTLSYPPVPLASWLGVAAPAPDQPERETGPGFTRPIFSPAASHLLVLPILTAEPLPRTVFESPSRMAFAALPNTAAAMAAHVTVPQNSEAPRATSGAATQSVRPTLERRSPAPPTGTGTAPPVPPGVGTEAPPEGGEAHPAAARRSPLAAALSALAVIERLTSAASFHVGRPDSRAVQALAFPLGSPSPGLPSDQRAFGRESITTPLSLPRRARSLAAAQTDDSTLTPAQRPALLDRLTAQRQRRLDAMPLSLALPIAPDTQSREPSATGPAPTPSQPPLPRRADATPTGDATLVQSPRPALVGRLAAQRQRLLDTLLAVAVPPPVSLPPVSLHGEQGARGDRRPAFGREPDPTWLSLPRPLRIGVTPAGRIDHALPAETPRPALMERLAVQRQRLPDIIPRIAYAAQRPTLALGGMTYAQASRRGAVQGRDSEAVSLPAALIGGPSQGLASSERRQSSGFVGSLVSRVRSLIGSNAQSLGGAAIAVPSPAGPSGVSALPRPAVGFTLPERHRTVPSAFDTADDRAAVFGQVKPAVTVGSGRDRSPSDAAGILDRLITVSSLRTEDNAPLDAPAQPIRTAPFIGLSLPRIQRSVFGPLPSPSPSSPMPRRSDAAPALTAWTDDGATRTSFRSGLPGRIGVQRQRFLGALLDGLSLPKPSQSDVPGTRRGPQATIGPASMRLSLPRRIDTAPAGEAPSAQTARPTLTDRLVIQQQRLLAAMPLSPALPIAPDTQSREPSATGPAPAPSQPPLPRRADATPTGDATLVQSPRPALVGRLAAQRQRLLDTLLAIAVPPPVSLPPVSLHGEQGARGDRRPAFDREPTFGREPDPAWLSLPRPLRIGATPAGRIDHALPAETPRPALVQQLETLRKRLTDTILPARRELEVGPSVMLARFSPALALTTTEAAPTRPSGARRDSTFPLPARFRPQERQSVEGPTGRLPASMLPGGEEAPRRREVFPERRDPRPGTADRPAKALPLTADTSRSVMPTIPAFAETLTGARPALMRLPTLTGILSRIRPGMDEASGRFPATPDVRRDSGLALPQRRAAFRTAQGQFSTATPRELILPSAGAAPEWVSALLSRYSSTQAAAETTPSRLPSEGQTVSGTAFPSAFLAALPAWLSPLAIPGTSDRWSSDSEATAGVRPVSVPVPTTVGLNASFSPVLSLPGWRGFLQRAGVGPTGGMGGVSSSDRDESRPPALSNRWLGTDLPLVAGGLTGSGLLKALPNRIIDGMRQSASPESRVSDAARPGRGGDMNLRAWTRPGAGQRAENASEPDTSWDEVRFSEAIGQIVNRTLQTQLLSPIRAFLMATLSRMSVAETAQDSPTGENSARSVIPRPPRAGADLSWPPAFPAGTESSDGMQDGPSLPTLGLPSLTAFPPLADVTGMSPQRRSPLPPRVLRRVTTGDTAAMDGTSRPLPVFPTRGTSRVMPSAIRLRPQHEWDAADGRDDSQGMTLLQGHGAPPALTVPPLEMLVAQSMRLESLQARYGHAAHGRDADTGAALSHALGALPTLPGTARNPVHSADSSPHTRRAGGTLMERLPEMPLPIRAASPEGQSAATFRDPLMIQRAVSGSEAASNAHGSPGHAPMDADSDATGGGTDINGLAKEVYSQLRRRLASEASRAGHR